MPLVKIEPYSANSSADFTFNNLIVTGNLYSNYSNSAFQAANSAGVYANAAFAAANTGGAGTDTWARSAANSASSYANSAFAAANTGSGGASGSYANSAYQAANSAGVYANASYTFANTINLSSNSAYSFANTINLTANAAFAIANAAWSGTTGTHANSAYASANNANVVNITQNTNITSAASYANGAFQAANSAGSYANSAYLAANVSVNFNALGTANSASSYANGAFLKANNALANTTGTFGGTLTVAGTLNADGLSITGTGGTISALNLIYSNTIFANSNVGIGVTTTSAKLDLGGTGVEIPQIIWSRGSDDSAFISKLKTGNTGTAAVQSSIGLDYLNDFASIKFYRASTAGEIHWYLGSTATVGTEQMRLNSTGLGIGTSAPSTKLHISSGTPVVTVTSTGTTASSQDFTTNSAAQRTTIGVERAAGGGLFAGSSAYAAVFGSAGAAVTQFATNNNVRVTIDTSGSVGIGTSSPASTLDVVGEIKCSRVNSSSEGGQINFARSSDNAIAWFIDVYGSTATPDLRLLNSPGGAGVTVVNGATSWSTYSDERLKTNLLPIKNAISILRSIRCVTYHRKDIDTSESKRRIGIVAQDILGKIDEALDNVTNETDGIDYLSVRYTELVPHLIKGIQEQQELIESLTSRLITLENK